MPTRLSVVWLCLVVSAQAAAQANLYYVDAVGGNDLNDGRSATTPWKTLTKVNTVTLHPGDSLSFKSGSSWIGRLAPLGSGLAGKPIVIGKYGGTAKPRFDGAGMTGTAVLFLKNQEFIEVNDLEITNDAATPGDRRGVLVSASNFGIVHSVHLRNLSIHHIRGIAGNGDAAKRTAGIGVEVEDDSVRATRFDDLRIEGCEISFIDNTGIYTDNRMPRARNEYPGRAHWPDRRFTNVQIRSNVIHHIAKNAIIVRFFDKGVVEHNVCYETALKTTGNTIFSASCDGTVFQYNEGYLNRSTGGDGSLYDADLRSPNTVWQYSYSHDNAHGLFWSCTVQEDSGIVCRYNISQNDRGIIFCMNYPVTSISCYNNVVFIDSALAPTIISERNMNSGTRLYEFVNNIIYNRSSTAGYHFRQDGYTRRISHNVFYGIHPASEPDDAFKISADPMFVNPGSGRIGIESVDGYRLREDSPCRDSGLLVHDHGRMDYWKNAVPHGSKPDRGAHELR